MPKSLIRSLIVIFALCSPFSPAFASAPENSDLEARIATLLAADNKQTENQPQLRINILTPAAKLAALCAQPDLRLSGRSVRLTGRRSVIARCGKKQQFIQIQISATGRYWVATQTLKPGQIIGAEDIQPVSGELDRLPAGLLLDPQRIIGSTPTRIIQPGSPLADNQLRRSWAVIANRTVEITAPGDGFLIHAKGKALDNAALDESVRVQTRTGQVVVATVTGQGQVSISLSN